MSPTTNPATSPYGKLDRFIACQLTVCLGGIITWFGVIAAVITFGGQIDDYTVYGLLSIFVVLPVPLYFLASKPLVLATKREARQGRTAL